MTIGLLTTVMTARGAHAAPVVRKHLVCAPTYACRFTLARGEKIARIEPPAVAHWRFRIVNDGERYPAGLYFGTDRSGAVAHVRLYSSSKLYDIYLTPNNSARGAFFSE
jgi:hypothetical protein